MGIHLNLIPLIRDAARRYGLSGRGCTFGVPDIGFGGSELAWFIPASAGFGGPLSAADLFAALGFGAVESLDVSDYEGADHVFDLNRKLLPDTLAARFDLVLNGGTLE